MPGSKLTAEQEQELARRGQAAEARARDHLLECLGELPELEELLFPGQLHSRRTRAAGVEALEAAVELAWTRSMEVKGIRRHARKARAEITAAQEARWELAMSATRIAYGEARKVAGAMDLHELAQEGFVGLYRAAMRFEPARGLRFSTYARWWARAAITRAIDKQARVVRLPASAIERRRNALKLIARWEKDGEPWTVDMVATELGLDDEEVAQLLDSLDDTYSLDAPLPGMDGATARTGHDTLASDQRDPVRALALLAEAQRIREAVATLPDRQREVIEALYLSGERVTLAEVGRRTGVSRERIRQVRNEAFELLRLALQ